MLGLFGVFAYNLFFMAALERLPASRAALIIALNPVITITISALVLKEHLSARRWLGVAIALFGVWIVISRGDIASIASAGVGAGELFMFGAVTSWALYTIIGRKVLGGLTPLAATNYAALWGTLLLACVAAPEFASLHDGAVRLAHDRRAAVSRRLRHRAGLRLVLHVGEEARHGGHQHLQQPGAGVRRC